MSKQSPVRQILRLGEVAELLGVCPATVKNWAKRGAFPAPVRLTGRTLVWHADAVAAFLESLLAHSKGGEWDKEFGMEQGVALVTSRLSSGLGGR